MLQRGTATTEDIVKPWFKTSDLESLWCIFLIPAKKVHNIQSN